jgi:hypothetical protein
MASRLADTGGDHAESCSAATKAHGVDTAYQAAAELALLLGASGYQASSPIAKIRRDLTGLLYADGIHDSLYRAAGKYHVALPADTIGFKPGGGSQPLPITAECRTSETPRPSADRKSVLEQHRYPLLNSVQRRR